MKQFTLFFFILAVVFITMGYMEIYLSSLKNEKIIEYRYVPRSIYDDIGTIEVSEKYNDLFENTDPIFERRNLYSNLV
jgi:hypothetical protein